MSHAGIHIDLDVESHLETPRVPQEFLCSPTETHKRTSSSYA